MAETLKEAMSTLKERKHLSTPGPMLAMLHTEGPVPPDALVWWKVRARPSKYTDEKDITKCTPRVVPLLRGEIPPTNHVVLLRF